MIHTVLTDDWGLRYPVIGAPMAGAADGTLAGAITGAGGLGMIGAGSRATTDFIARECETVKACGRFGVGLMVWALKERPELLDAALSADPYLVSLSFGDPTPYVARCHAHGVRVATQVHTRDEAVRAEQAGVDIVVAQGTDAGGHTGSVGTLPLLQIVLDAVRVPVLAAGGIASPAGLAAVLAAGAAGAWIGTAFLASPESRHDQGRRELLLSASETDTVQTHVFDRALGIPWPDEFPGRALKNAFTARWHGREDALPCESQEAAPAYVYAGQAVGLVRSSRPAAEVLRTLGDGAEALLRRRLTDLVREGPSEL